MRVLLLIVQTSFNRISETAFRPDRRQLTPQPFILVCKFPILEEYFVKLRLFIPYPEQKARFENICLKVILLHAGNLLIYVEN